MAAQDCRAGRGKHPDRTFSPPGYGGCSPAVQKGTANSESTSLNTYERCANYESIAEIPNCCCDRMNFYSRIARVSRTNYISAVDLMQTLLMD